MQGTGQPSSYYALDIQRHQDTPPLPERRAPSACCLDSMQTLYKNFPLPAKIVGGILVGVGSSLSSPITIGTGAGLIVASFLAKVIECKRNGCSRETLYLETAATIAAGLGGVVGWTAFLNSDEDPVSP